MVPQDEDCVIQSVQAVLHSGLGGPEGLEREGRGRGEAGQRSLLEAH